MLGFVGYHLLNEMNVCPTSCSTKSRMALMAVKKRDFHVIFVHAPDEAIRKKGSTRLGTGKGVRKTM